MWMLCCRYGVMDGSIVKVHCLAGAPSKLKLNSLRDAAAAAATAADLSRAAAQAGAEAAAAAAPPQQATDAAAAAAAVAAAAAAAAAAGAAAGAAAASLLAGRGPEAASLSLAGLLPLHPPAAAAVAPPAAPLAPAVAPLPVVLIKQEPGTEEPAGAMAVGSVPLCTAGPAQQQPQQPNGAKRSTPELPSPGCTARTAVGGVDTDAMLTSAKRMKTELHG